MVNLFDLALDNYLLKEDKFIRTFRPELEPAWVVRQRYRKALNDQIAKASKRHPTSVNSRSTISNEVFPSRTSFELLERTWIHRLHLFQPAEGEYVLVRVIEKGHSIVGWHTVIEDDQGAVCVLSVYNYPSNELFSVGTVLIIKEPYFKITISNSLFVRCDCPTDIIVLRPSHPLFDLGERVEWKNELFDAKPDPLMAKPKPNTAKQWKDRGNQLFDKKELILAREAYNLGVKVCNTKDPTLKLLKLNLVAVHLKLEYYEAAMEQAQEILKVYPDEKKAKFRLGKAYYMLRRYEEALMVFNEFVEKYPKEEEGPRELKKAKTRVEEQNGKIDIDKLRRRAIKNPMKEIDHADFKGPLSIKRIKGKGRGVVLTQNVKKGDILMAYKALAATLNPSQNVGTHVDVGRSLDNSLERIEIMAKVTEMVYKNPNTFGPQVYDLFSGEQNQEKPAQLFCEPQTKTEPICDVERISAISINNFFQVSFSKPELKPQIQGAALVTLPSYINHSCIPNATYDFFNNMMVVNALKDMKAGTELTIPYIPGELSFELRTKMLCSRGFQCHCTKCNRRL